VLRIKNPRSVQAFTTGSTEAHRDKPLRPSSVPLRDLCGEKAKRYFTGCCFSKS